MIAKLKEMIGVRKNYDYHLISQVRVQGESNFKPARWTLCLRTKTKGANNTKVAFPSPSPARPGTIYWCEGPAGPDPLKKGQVNGTR